MDAVVYVEELCILKKTLGVLLNTTSLKLVSEINAQCTDASGQ